MIDDAMVADRITKAAANPGRCYLSALTTDEHGPKGLRFKNSIPARFRGGASLG
jgi:hypothetical protein